MTYLHEAITEYIDNLPEANFTPELSHVWGMCDEHQDAYTVDPYGAVIERIRGELALGYEHKGSMSEREYTILKNIEENLRRLDNA